LPTETGYTNSRIVHSNYGFAVYDNYVIGKLEDLTMIVEKDAEYDVIIGSGGKPFGQPIVKLTKFNGSFTKGMFKTEDLDKVIALDSVGNSRSSFLNEDNDISNFNSDNNTDFADDDTKSLVFFPVSNSEFAIAFGGIIITKYDMKILNNKYARITAEFKGKFIEYKNKLKTL